MRRFFRNSWVSAIIIISLISFLFHARLFIPHVNLVATPEFVLNDAIQLSYASKFWYFEKLHSLQLPIWSTHMGVGLPVLGEGQNGIFFLPNLILYGVLPSAPIAYNLSLILVTITAALGTYWWLTLLNIPWLLAIIGGLTFSCSGFFLYHQQHITLLQSFSLLPWLFATTHQLIHKPKRSYIVLFAFFLSQQLFAGFMQAVLITLTGTTLYAGMALLKTPDKYKKCIPYMLACILGVFLSGIQLAPSIEFLQHIYREYEGSQFSTQFSMSFNSFLSFLQPYAIGNPKDATYDTNIKDSGLLFWETNGYVGIVPIILLFIACVVSSIKKTVVPYIIGVGIFALLALGKYSPLSFIFSIPPFSFFRVPARYVILCSFFLVTISTAVILSIQNRYKKIHHIKIVTTSLLLVNLCSILPFWYTYHDYQPPSAIQQKPEIASYLSNDSIVYHLNTTKQQRDIYMTKGWINIAPYAIFNNALEPNANVFWDITTYDAYPSRILKRSIYAEGIIQNDIIFQQNEASISAMTERMMALTSIDTIVSGIPISKTSTYQFRTHITDGTNTLYVYKTEAHNPRAYMASSIIPVTTMTDVVITIKQPVFKPMYTALVETKTLSQPIISPGGTVTIHSWSDTFIEIQTESSDSGLLVIANSYYPGWHATIDGKPTDILPTNVRFMGIFVPKGQHTIFLSYKPSSIIIGGSITLIGLIIVLCMLLPGKRIDIFWKSLFI